MDINLIYNGLDQTKDAALRIEHLKKTNPPVIPTEFVMPLEKADSGITLREGRRYLVPCVIWPLKGLDAWLEEYRDYELEPYSQPQHLKYTPIFNHPHSDRENGQSEVHYHRDDRWRTSAVRNYRLEPILRPKLTPGAKIEYIALEYDRAISQSITPIKLISKSVLKHKCIYKGKCPHRGYDLTHQPSINGKITCPLHGLEFDSKTKQLLNDPTI